MDLFTTDRLAVRTLEPTDLDAFHAITGDVELMRFVDAGVPLTREQTAYWIDKTRENFARDGYTTFAVVDRESRRMIGYAGLIHRPGTEQIEITYVLEKAAWGRGLATELARGLVDYGFRERGLRRIEATIDPDNRASRRVVEKLGFRLEGIETDDDGDTAVYAIERNRESGRG